MIRIEDILDRIEQYNPDGDFDFIRRAYVFSAKEHRGQVRLSGEPYMIHPLEVAGILADMKLDEVSVVVGLLHDVLEDTDVTPETVNEFFGEEVRHIVEGVTKLGGIIFDSSEEHQAENFRKMLMAMIDDIRVILVKLADRSHNMRTLEYLPPVKQKRIARETLEIYAPIANRLGIGWMKNELEDTSLKYLEPDTYDFIKKKLAVKLREREKRIERLKSVLEKRLQEEQIEGRVQGRAKHIYSIYYKMKFKEVPFDEIYDFIGLRVILASDDKAECYRVLGAVHDLWTMIPGRFRDFVSMPKENMYQSLHSTVITDDGQPVEVQIRTEKMHRLAENGVAVHWIYKTLLGKGKKNRQQLKWMRQLMEWQEELKDPREFLDTVKIDLFPNEVYIFTPQGEVRSFPKGATPVDFAYSIHSDVGHRCVGAKVNGSIVPLKYMLQTGDTVEILTSTHHKPNRDWLSIVATARARAKIRAFIKSEERERSIELGKEILERELGRAGLKLKAFRKMKALERMAASFNNLDEFGLMAGIGYGKISPRMLENWIAQEQRGDDEAVEKGPDVRDERILDPGRPSDLKKVVIKGVDDVLVRFSKCCNPVPGDEIIGFISRGKGLAIHTRSCTNMTSLDCNPDRLIEVKWARRQEGYHQVRLLVVSEDQPGVLASITSMISTIGVNIVKADIHTSDDQRGTHNITVTVKNLKQLQKVMEGLRKAKGVIEVHRI